MIQNMPLELPTSKKLIMKIVDIIIEPMGFDITSRKKYIFVLRIWNNAKLEHAYRVKEIMYDGFSRDYIVDFIETATDEEIFLGFTDIQYAIGAVFIGMIKTKTKVNYHNHKTVFYNVVALKHLGYVMEGGKEDGSTETAES